MLEYKTIDGYSQTEWEVQKSRFISYVNHVENETQAQDFVNQIRKKHFDATHNCYAYIIGEHSDTQKSNDDGEPSGTAGVPILEVLKKNELSDVVVVVTRYFGGIKLGAGGLIRAYGKSATLGLEASVIVKKSVFNCYNLSMDYDLLGTLENYLHQKEIRIKDKNYTDKVDITILLPQNDSENTLKDITNLSAARCKITKLDTVYLNIPVEK
ncbi:MAG TPA: YigZ family protein [Candidatus Megamonas gallistercoris]|nr:YigZ family protein [Candidatus Megamonas gallistercoris]